MVTVTFLHLFAPWVRASPTPQKRVARICRWSAYFLDTVKAAVRRKVRNSKLRVSSPTQKGLLEANLEIRKWDMTTYFNRYDCTHFPRYELRLQAETKWNFLDFSPNTHFLRKGSLFCRIGTTMVLCTFILVVWISRKKSWQKEEEHFVRLFYRYPNQRKTNFYLQGLEFLSFHKVALEYSRLI